MTLNCQIGDCMIRVFATRSLFLSLEFKLQACTMYLARGQSRLQTAS